MLGHANRRLGVTVCVCVALASAAVIAQAVDPLARWDIPSLFHISKSQNRNQVHYGLHLGAGCVPRGVSPVFAYWRELEIGTNATSPLLDYEQAAYGIAPDQRVSRARGKVLVHFVLRAFPDRALVAVPRVTRAGCSAIVRTQISHVEATLERIHLELGFLWSIQSLTIEGRALDDGVPLREVIKE
jgi:hypothetical protein